MVAARRILPSVMLAVLACTLAGCQRGAAMPTFGTTERAPTRTIAGERVELERYGGSWVAIAEVPSADRPTHDLLWSRLNAAGIPGTSMATGRMQRLRVPAPHAREARRLMATTPGAGERFQVLGR